MRPTRAVFLPLITTVPRVGRSISATSFSTVLLPAPEGPVRYTISPAAISKLTRFSASRPPDSVLLRCRSESRRCLLLIQHGAGKRRGAERLQILDSFANADKADRDAQFASDGDENAALG